MNNEGFWTICSVPVLYTVIFITLETYLQKEKISWKTFLDLKPKI